MPTAKTSFAASVDDQEHIVHAGDVLPATHPVVRARPELFEAEAATGGAKATTRAKRTTKR